MRTIAVVNQKGGVGKTTTAVNVAAALAAAGRKVVVIDLDPQAHLTIHLGVEPRAVGAGAYEVLTQGADFAGSLMLVRPSLWLLAASIDLVGAETELVNVVGREIILREAMQASQDQFDLCLIDCPPSLSVLSLNALAAAEEVLIPLQPHFLALQGFGKLLQTVDLVNKRINPRLKVTGVLLCMNDTRASLSNEVRADIEQFLTSARGANNAWSGAVILPTFIRRNIKLAEAPSYGKTILEYDPDCNGAEDYRRVANFFLGITESPAEAAPDDPSTEVRAAPPMAEEPPAPAATSDPAQRETAPTVPDSPADVPAPREPQEQSEATPPAAPAAGEQPDEASSTCDEPESTDDPDDPPPGESLSAPAPPEVPAPEPPREDASPAPDDIPVADVPAPERREDACTAPDAPEPTDGPDGPTQREAPPAGAPPEIRTPEPPREDASPAPICIRPIRLPVPQRFAPIPICDWPVTPAAEPVPVPGNDPSPQAAPSQLLCASRPSGDIRPTRTADPRRVVFGLRGLRLLGGLVKRGLTLVFRPHRKALPGALSLETAAR